MRKWTIQEANAALPRVREMLRQARQAAAAVRDAQSHMDDLQVAYGDTVHEEDHPGHGEWAVWRKKREDAKASLHGAIAAFERQEIVLKDVELGLVDFHADHLGQVVFLCWKDGEAAVENWHPLEGGFAKRRPLPRLSGV